MSLRLFLYQWKRTVSIPASCLGEWMYLLIQHPRIPFYRLMESFNNVVNHTRIVKVIHVFDLFEWHLIYKVFSLYITILPDIAHNEVKELLLFGIEMLIPQILAKQFIDGHLVEADNLSHKSTQRFAFGHGIVFFL